NESAACFDEKYEVGDRILCRDVESNGPETSQANEEDTCIASNTLPLCQPKEILEC
ncbi:hypothetical protein FRX31_034289, partial [Thalictrum thalictroides]